MDSKRIAEIEARVNEATDGPHQPRWVAEGMPADPCRFGVISEATGREVLRCWDQQDAVFHSHAHQDIIDLIAYIRKLERIAGTQADLLKAHGIIRAPNDEEMKWAREAAQDILSQRT